MPKISALPELNTPASADVMPIVDVSESETSKITIANLLDYFSANLITGDVVKPADIAMWCAQKTSNQTMNQSAATLITFPVQIGEYRNTDYYNTANSRWTAPYAGWVQLVMTLSFSEGNIADDTHNIGFRKNGSALTGGTWVDNMPGWSAAGKENVQSFIVSVPCAAGDYFDCYYDGITTGTATIIMANAATFSGQFIRDYSDI